MNLEQINKLPKIELHLHLDGSLPLETASKLSNLSLDELKSIMIAKDKCENLTEYLTKFDFPISLMQTRKNLEIVSEALVNSLENQNVIYAEIRFAPMFHVSNGLSYEDVVESVLKGLRKNTNVKTNLILCLMKGFGEESNLKTFEVAKKYLDKGVCAIDIAGDEVKYPNSDYSKFFTLAKKANIPYTIHAGESRGADEVLSAINLGAKRIGHGVHSIEDEEVLKVIKDKGILLEICPTSNIQTNSITSYEKHPISVLYEKGIPLNINTDNSTVSNISLSEEYLKLHNILGFNIEDFKKINIMAIEHAFLNKEEKEALLKRI